MEIKVDENWKQEDGMYKCPICSKKYTKNGISTHIWRSHGEGVNHNPNINYRTGSRISWNKGLTKENCESIRLSSEHVKEGYKSGRLKPSMLGKKLTKEQRQKLSNTISKKVADGTWHYSFSKVRTKVYESKENGDVKLMGSWEYEFAKYLDENNIKWKRPKEKFYYEFEGLKKGYGFYNPDFYLIEENLWIEIKGYETDKDRAKWKWFPHNLKVIKGKELKEKYGLNIIT